jgi:N-acetylglucosaminyl-diphospho-decaprenol L-rhamnosyltransferase
VKPPAGDIDVSALVVNYNTTQLALDMLESLAAQRPRAPDGRPLRLEFVLVDNASPQLDHEKVEAIRALGRSPRLPGRVILHDANAGYAGGMNLAFAEARGSHVLVLNPDLVFLPGCVERLYAALFGHDDVGAVGPVGYWDRGREVMLPPNILPTLWDLVFCTLAHVVPGVNRRYTSARLDDALRVWTARGNVALDMLSGACVMLSRSTIDAIGGLFDPGYPLYYEDTDLFRRIKASGRRLLMVKGAEIVHFYNRSGTTNPGEAMRRYWVARDYYYGKWYGAGGRLVEHACRRFLASPLAARLRRRMSRSVVDLGDVTSPPILELGRHCRRFVLEMCQDPGFLLAAGILGSGRSWTPGASFWRAFGESEYFLRAVDLSQGRPEELHVFRFRRVPAGGEAVRAAAEQPERVLASG